MVLIPHEIPKVLEPAGDVSAFFSTNMADCPLVDSALLIALVPASRSFDAPPAATCRQLSAVVVIVAFIDVAELLTFVTLDTKFIPLSAPVYEAAANRISVPEENVTDMLFAPEAGVFSAYNLVATDKDSTEFISVIAAPPYVTVGSLRLV